MSVVRRRDVREVEQKISRTKEELCGDSRDAHRHEVGLAEELSSVAHPHTFQTYRTPKEGGENEETLSQSGPSQLI